MHRSLLRHMRRCAEEKFDRKAGYMQVVHMVGELMG